MAVNGLSHFIRRPGRSLKFFDVREGSLIYFFNETLSYAIQLFLNPRPIVRFHETRLIVRYIHEGLDSQYVGGQSLFQLHKE